MTSTNTLTIPAEVTDTGAYVETALTPAGVGSLRWDEPAGASSPRGWLHRGPVVIGWYLDYGPDYYRSPHQYCGPGRHLPCRDCQPGNILCSRYPNGPGEDPHTSRYVETINQARRYVETGHV